MPEFLTGPNYHALPRNPQKWLIDELIPFAGLVNLYGRPKTHKSFAALSIAAAIAGTADTWNGFPVMQHGPVMYLQIDTPRSEWGDRMHTLSTHGLDFSNVWTADMQMVPTYPFSILAPNGNLVWLKQQIATIKPVLVIYDTLLEVHGGNENEAMVMQNVIGQLVRAALPVLAASLLISHQKKDSAYMKAGGDDLMDDARGSSYVSGRMDNIIRLTETRLTWKGRSSAGAVCTKIDPDTQLVVLDANAAKEADAVTRVVAREKAKNPGVTKKECANALQAELGWDKSKHKTALRRVDYLFKK